MINLVDAGEKVGLNAEADAANYEHADDGNQYADLLSEIEGVIRFLEPLERLSSVIRGEQGDDQEESGPSCDRHAHGHPVPPVINTAYDRTYDA